MTDICFEDDQSEAAQLQWDAERHTIFLKGCWTVTQIVQLESSLKQLLKEISDKAQVDASGITNLDSAGALFICDLIRSLELILDTGQVPLIGLDERYQSLLRLISKEYPENKIKEPSGFSWNIFAWIGRFSLEKLIQFLTFIAFIGEFFVYAFKAVLNPARMQWRSIVAAIEDSGWGALPILALMSFLIGVVLAYQLAIQLKTYGANIFIVDVTGIAILREFAPLIAAVIMAGRTSTSFAALIGTMKVNEEIDALHTMGVVPIERLVLPRVFGLLIAMPLLIVWSDIFAVFGSMIMAKSMLHVNYHAFLERFDMAVKMKHYLLGIVKAPVFALIIAGVGCFQGFQVGSSADSVGRQTTKAAVQSIFLIIIADAFFSVLFNWMDL